MADPELPTLLTHLSLLSDASSSETDVTSTPIFTEPVRKYAQGSVDTPFEQYGLLGFDAVKMASPSMSTDSPVAADDDPRIFQNVAAPASVFICGSQGSGKSHKLSCILENCLVPSKASVLPRPLTGVVFHYDTFVSDAKGAPCEAAHLASSEGVQVRVLCPPTNIAKLKDIYGKLPRVTVEELRLDEKDLNTKRMLDLMAVSSVQGGGMPLYLHVVTRILRDLRIDQQRSGGSFNYRAFKHMVESEDMTSGQMAPLQQRLETLQSFMPEQQVHIRPKSNQYTGRAGNIWTPKPGQLTVVDLSCPCITREAACALFNICLSLFLEQDHDVGRVVALDEAHKYMTDSEECATLTETLLATIRLQRHLGARVVISTQEPTVSPKLLDLCSITIVHRFSSPDWFRSLRKHLAGANDLAQGTDGEDASPGCSDQAELEPELQAKILSLRTGEGLLFSPYSLIGLAGAGSSRAFKAHFGDKSRSVLASRPSDRTALESRSSSAEQNPSEGSVKPVALGSRPLQIRIRKRITADGGRTVMAG